MSPDVQILPNRIQKLPPGVREWRQDEIVLELSEGFKYRDRLFEELQRRVPQNDLYAGAKIARLTNNWWDKHKHEAHGIVEIYR